MTNGLDVGVVDLKGAVVWANTLGGVLGEEERVMVNPLLLAINMHECSDLGSRRNSKDVCCLQVEVLRVEVVRLLKVADKSVRRVSFKV